MLATFAPALCPTCTCPLFWLSIYGGQPRCANCDPWPLEAAVHVKLGVVVRPDGGWEYERLGDWRKAKGADSNRLVDVAAGRGGGGGGDASGGPKTNADWFDSLPEWRDPPKWKPWMKPAAG